MKPIDLQINGYAGTDFNSPCSADEINRACELLAQDNVGGILATVITADIPIMMQRLEIVAQARNENALTRKMIVGIHIEGPFISNEPGYVGAHNPKLTMPASVDVMKRLHEAASGITRLVTLAPENDPQGELTQWLVDQNIIVAAGHTNASREQIAASIDSGLSMFTHLGNGCPMKMHRHDNIIQRALCFSEKLWCCFIADGVHVDFFALKNYLKIAGINRSIIVTDAISAARLGPGNYRLGDWEIAVGDDLIAMSPDRSHFIGSTMTIPRTIENLQQIGFCTDEVNQLISTNPRIALGLPESELTEANQ